MPPGAASAKRCAVRPDGGRQACNHLTRDPTCAYSPTFCHVKRATARSTTHSTRPGGRSRAPVAAGPVVVTRAVHFNAAHRLHNPARSAAWNRRVFGPCNHPNWHGHNYVLEISVLGPVDPETGYVIDLGHLSELGHREIVAPCDHRNLNLDVPFLRGVLPSTENLLIAFWERLAPHIAAPARLYRLRLRETERNSGEYFGPGGPPPA